MFTFEQYNYSIFEFVFSLLPNVDVSLLLSRVDWNWWAVSIPFWVYVVGTICGGIMDGCFVFFVANDIGHQNSIEVASIKNITDYTYVVINRALCSP